MNVAVDGPLPESLTTPEIEGFVRAVLTAEGVPDASALGVSFVDAAEIADLNERFMGRTGPTDVLSFPIEPAAPGIPPAGVEDGPPLELGDIFICGDVVERHAMEYGVGFEDEMFLMIVHGVLHILGWDHQTDEEAEAMEEREGVHLATIGRSRR